MPRLDRTIHERSRLLILSHLASNRKREISFNELQEQLGFTSGNLSAQLKKLRQAGYVTRGILRVGAEAVLLQGDPTSMLEELGARAPFPK